MNALFSLVKLQISKALFNCSAPAISTAMAPESLNRIYADEMQNHPYGYGLYQPTFSTVIKPGSVGFFDPSGFWSPLADLTDPKSLDALGLKPPRHALAPAPSQKQSWGPMTSKSTSAHNLDASAGIEYVPILSTTLTPRSISNLQYS
jgi:hypothetical protein